MPATLYKIVFDGQINDGQDPVKVKHNLMTIFKLSEDSANKLFSGARVVIKKDLDEQAARKYQMAFEKAGAICAIEPSQHKSEGVHEGGQPAPHDKQTGLGDATIAEAGSELTDYVPPSVPDIDISSLSMGEAGEVIMSHPVVSPVSIDTGNLGVDPVGVTLDSAPQLPEANINTEHLTVAPPGERLADPGIVKEPSIDTSKFSLEK